ncbi:MAG TPA: hypothetical protein VG778_10320 [Blastocatellia bacterium]|jgi:hypothetical protein|nr:hypothetical protein [Blastocatellia bacterium]
MHKLVLMLAIPLLVLPGFAQTRNCLRIMPMDELTRNSAFIARVKVKKTHKANYRGAFSQHALLKTIDVIDGDFTLSEVHVLARASVRCAEDDYIEKQEMLVFLAPEGSLYRTQNFQYGQFIIDGEIVKGWRDKANKPVDKLYAEVRLEIEAYVHAAHHPPTTTPPPKIPEE